MKTIIFVTFFNAVRERVKRINFKTVPLALEKEKAQVDFDSDICLMLPCGTSVQDYI